SQEIKKKTQDSKKQTEHLNSNS
ncbi:WAP domain-containing protein, partial [Trichonephila inaurata madagascariensis]